MVGRFLEAAEKAQAHCVPIHPEDADVQQLAFRTKRGSILYVTKW